MRWVWFYKTKIILSALFFFYFSFFRCRFLAINSRVTTPTLSTSSSCQTLNLSWRRTASQANFSRWDFYHQITNKVFLQSAPPPIRATSCAATATTSCWSGTTAAASRSRGASATTTTLLGTCSTSSMPLSRGAAERQRQELDPAAASTGSDVYCAYTTSTWRL